MPTWFATFFYCDAALRVVTVCGTENAARGRRGTSPSERRHCDQIVTHCSGTSACGSTPDQPSCPFAAGRCRRDDDETPATTPMKDPAHGRTAELA